MNNLFEPTAAVEIIERLKKIQSTSKPQWGKMNAAQMMAHCRASFEVYFGEKKMKRGLMGILFGSMAKKKLLSPTPFPKNLPTAKEFLVKDDRNFESERNQLVRFVNRFATEGYTVTKSKHPFFGSLSSQEWALLNYRHLDHHLQQFGV